MGHPDGAHTHGSGGSGLGEVLVVAQHDHRPLAWRQLQDEPPDGVAFGRLGCGVLDDAYNKIVSSGSVSGGSPGQTRYRRAASR